MSMDMQIRFIDVDNVLWLHRHTLEEEGGLDGVKDHGMLESAVAMPRQQFDGVYLHSDLAAMAAAYMFHLCMNHAFNDGNKRVAVLAATTFLIVNGHEVVADPAEFEELTLPVAAGEIPKNQLIEWFRSHVQSVE